MTAFMMSFDVCVHGTGPVGMSLALALSRQGLSVAWVRPAETPPAAADVRTYALSQTSVALLQQLKIWSALPSDARTAVTRMHVEGDAAGAALDFAADAQGVDALSWIVDAAELERTLRSALGFAPHVTVVDPGAHDAALHAHAEGRGSPALASLGVRFTQHPYGQSAVAARLRAQRPHDGVARQWFRSPDVLALLPFDRPEAGHGYGLVWSVPDERAQELLALDDAAFEAALQEATRGEAGPLTLAAERASWPLRHGQAERVSGPGWVLLGDAAHVVHPLAGQGLNLGLADVVALTEVLAARESFRSPGDERLLRRYARRRYAPVLAMGQLTDGLLHLFAHPNPVARELRNRGLTLLNALPPVKRFLTARAMQS